MQIPTQKLLSGYDMPVLGVGTWQVKGRECTDMVTAALDMGYNHVDTALAYGNHHAIAEALRGRDREALFLTSKVPPELIGYEDLVASCERSLRELEVDYLDLFLIHWPNESIPLEQSFGALAQLVEEGKIRSAGVSNYKLELMRESVQVSPVPLCNDQVKFNPMNYPRELAEFCYAQGITVTAYSPLGIGELVDLDLLGKIGAKYGKTGAQVALRWLVEKGAIVIPRAKQEQHLREDLETVAWSLEPEDVTVLDNLPGQTDNSYQD
jgi:diketogulonate reductase-like aldo/keto reductase